MKHAYLILAHNDFDVLRLLLEALDDVQNDVYIHFDQKIGNPPSLHMEKAGLFIVENRVNVYWGDVSVIEAEYRLYEEAARRQEYSYYHLLSGVDFPLKKQEEIHSFFEENKGKEFLGFYQGDSRTEIDRKMRRVHVFSTAFRSENLFLKAYRATLLRVQMVTGYRRNKTVEFKKGTQWGSFTGGFVKYMIDRKESVLAMYRGTFCSDEIYKQTLCWNSDFRSKVFDLENEARGSMRCVSWKDGEMLSWSMEDYNTLIKSNLVFARKFSTENIDVLKKLSENLN